MNKTLLVGPDLLQSLLHVLMHFRQHHFAVSVDIEGMFLQVGYPIVINLLCVFYGARKPPRIWNLFNTTGILSVTGTPRRARVSHFSKQVAITLKSFLEFLKQNLLGSTWIITLIRLVLLGLSKDYLD